MLKLLISKLTTWFNSLRPTTKPVIDTPSTKAIVQNLKEYLNHIQDEADYLELLPRAEYYCTAVTIEILMSLKPGDIVTEDIHKDLLSVTRDAHFLSKEKLRDLCLKYNVSIHSQVQGSPSLLNTYRTQYA